MREREPARHRAREGQLPVDPQRGEDLEDTHEGADEHIDRLAHKYLGADEYPNRFPGEQRVILRLRPDRVRYYNPNG